MPLETPFWPPGAVVDQPTHGLDLCGHAGQGMGDGLEVPDGLAAHLALAGLVYVIAEGTSEIQRNIIARSLEL